MKTNAAEFIPFPAKAAVARRPVLTSILRGARQHCPNCGKGPLFRAYLKVNDYCPVCREALYHQRADDAPPYMTIFVVGHIMVAGVVAADIALAWPLWLHALVWLPLTIALSLVLLPIIKGGLVGLQWALRMHGFGETAA